MYKKIFVTGFLFIGILFFCFGQNTKQNFIDELKSSVKKTRRKTPEFLQTITELKVKYKDHLENDCSDRIELERNLGAYYIVNKDYDTGMEYWLDTGEKSIPACENVADSLKAQVFINLEGGYKVLGNSERREVYIDRLKDILRNDHVISELFQAKICSRIADFYIYQDELDLASIWLGKSLAIYNKYPINNKTLLALKLYADNLYYLQDYDGAIVAYENLRVKAKNLYENDKTNKYIYNSISGLTNQHLYKNEYKKAKVYIDELLAVGNEKANFKWIFEGHYWKSIWAEEQGDIEMASNELSKAIEIIESDAYGVKNLRLTKFYIKQAENLGKLKQYSQAKEFITKAFKRTMSGSGHEGILFPLRDKIILDELNFVEAGMQAIKIAQKGEYSSDQILDLSIGLDSILFRQNTNVDGDNSKAIMLELHHENCQIALKYIFENKLQDKYKSLTAYFISASKSVALFESIAMDDQIPDNLKESYSELKKKEIDLISGITVAVEDEDQNIIDSLSEIYYKLSYELEDLNEQLKKYDLNIDYRSYKENIVGKAKKNLSQNQALVELFYGVDYIFGYSISNDLVSFHFDSIPEVLNTDFLKNLYTDNQESIALMNSNLEELSKYFKPFFPKDIKSLKDVTIISDGKLLYLPFEILQFDGKDLIRDVNINYAFSYNLNQYDYSNSDRPEYDYLGLGMKYGDALLDNIKESSQITRSYDGQVRLSPLPFAVEEIKSGHTLYGGKMFLENDCTIDNLVNHAENAKIIHIANHSLLNDSNSNLSSIVFGNADAPDLYNVIDIKALELKADLAILSSCNSGIGEIFDGNGIRSLGQSFAQAGCPAVMVNLWEANDKSSRFIIDKFNQNIKEGLHKSEALRKAKIDYLDQATPSLKHPKYWANIILIGNNDPIKFNDGTNWYYYLGGILIFVFLILLFLRMKK